MTLKDIDFSKFLYNPKYPHFVIEMEKEEEFKFIPMQIKKKAALTYICLMYDPQSPIFEKEKDLIRRKKLAGQIAGFPYSDKDGFSDAAKRLMAGESKEFNDAIVHYAFLTNSVYVQMYAVLEINFERIMKDLYSKYDAKLSEEADKTMQKMEDIREKIFGGKEFIIELHKALSGKARKASEYLRIEPVNEQFKKDGLKDLNPYPGYEPNYRMKYAGTTKKT